MSTEHWADRWANANTPWHRSEADPDLVSRAAEFLGDSPKRVFVPLCGKTVDVSWLAAAGHHVVGVELIEDGIAQLCTEQGIDATVTDEAGFRVYRAPNIELFVGDLFALTPERTGAIDRVWDRGSMIAFDPDDHQRYADAVRALCGADTSVLLSVLEYDRSVMQGPPWPVPESAVRKTYDGCNIEQLRRDDVIADSPMWQEVGHAWWIAALYSIAW